MTTHTTPVVELRPMGIGDILDATFRLYKSCLVPFLVISLIAFVPYGLWTIGVNVAFVPSDATVDPFTQEVAMDSWSGRESDALAFGMLAGLGNLIFALIVLPLVQAALTYTIAGAILGDRLTAGQSYARAAGRLVPLILTQLLAGLVIVLGLLLLIVPGIIFSLWFMLIAPVVILERVSGSRGMGRSRELMKGNLSKGLGLLLVVFLLRLVIELAAGFALGLVPWPHLAIGTFFMLLVLAALLPIQTAPLILLYYDLRVRKEAFDLERLADTVAVGQARPVLP